jgi:hypothetical protein
MGDKKGFAFLWFELCKARTAGRARGETYQNQGREWIVAREAFRDALIAEGVKWSCETSTTDRMIYKLSDGRVFDEREPL